MAYGSLWPSMAKESFLYPETRQLFTTLEQISQRSGVSRGQAFVNVLRASVCACAAEMMETEYFDAIKDHTDGPRGRRGVDLFPVFLGQAIDAMSRTDNDVLGDCLQGGVSYAEHGLYLTPQPVAALMAGLTIGTNEQTEDGSAPMIADPCCGSGLLLMEASKVNPDAELVGTDLDARCCDIASLNLGLRGKFGWIICGNSLSREVRFVYRIGSFFHESPNGRRRGVIRSVPPEQCPVLPELRQGTRDDLLAPLASSSQRDGDSASLPTIVEVPRWALRLEERTAAMEAADSPTAERSDPEATQEKDDDGEPKEQRTLF